MRFLPPRAPWLGAVLCALALALLPAPPAAAQAGAASGGVAGGGISGGGTLAPLPVIPNFWNVERRIERPDAASIPGSIRFLTSDDYPPFNFVSADGALMGFHVDLARAICAELTVTCTIQALPFDTLVDRLEQGRGDAIIAGLATKPATRERVDFTERYLGTPARFAARRDTTLREASPEQVASKRVAVVAGTAHEAYLRAFFNEAGIRPYPDAASARAALKSGEVDLLFGDGIGLALWLNGTSSANCCVFVGGPFTESRYFGDGLAVAVKPGNDSLRTAIDYALQRVWEKGVYADLYLRWFPIGFY